MLKPDSPVGGGGQGTDEGEMTVSNKHLYVTRHNAKFSLAKLFLDE